MALRVSVIIPNYNYDRTLGMCIRAVQGQTEPPHELIVVDDGSTDTSVQVARSLGAHVIRSCGNSGVAAARNLGAAHATGDVLFFVDSDVALAPDALEQAIAIFKSDPRIGSVCGIYDPTPLIRDSLVEEYRSLQAHYWRASSEGDVTFGFFSLGGIRADVFAELGPFNTALKQTEEIDYGSRLSDRYRLVLTSRVHGRHDDDHELVPMLRKLFRRGRLRIPLYARRRRFARGFETASRAWGSLAALAAVATLPLPLVAGPWGWAAPGVLLLTSIGADAGMYRFVRAQRGSAFLVFFACTHLLVNLAIATGVGVGAAQWLASSQFRRMYDTPPTHDLAALPEAREATA
jgi:glycosyltransferase involved in cell wall biosynthesis